MTREEAIEKVAPRLSHIQNMPLAKKIKWIKEFIHHIYDDFENRTCENCKYFNGASVHSKKRYCTIHHDSWDKGEFFEFNLGENFGCNKWEDKK